MVPIKDVFNLYRPAIIRALIFTHKGGRGGSGIGDMEGMRGEVILRRGMLIYLIRHELSRDGTWTPLTSEALKTGLKGMAERRAKEVARMKRYIPQATYIGYVDMLACGVEEGYWHTEDVEFLPGPGGVIEGFKGVTAVSKIQALNSIISGTEDGRRDVSIRGNALDTGTEVYSLTPEFMLLSVRVGTGTGSEGGDLAAYQSEVERSAVAIASLMGYRMYIAHLSKRYITRYKAKDAWIKKRAMSLRREVRTILDAPNGRKSKGSEENVLRLASRYFFKTTDTVYSMDSDLTKIEVLREEMEYLLEPFRPLKRGDGTIVESMTEGVMRESRAYIRRLEGLKKALHNSEASLRNSLDLLNTYMESEQRISAERSTRALGILSLIFAAFGITDTISNFYIYYLQNPTTPTLIEAITSFGITMIWPVMFLIVAYYLYLRRKW